MRTLKLISFLFLAVFIITGCVLVNNGDQELMPGCYRTAIPDPHSPDDYPPIEEFYIQFWSDGTGEGGFWADTLTESDFFEWELSGDTIKFTPDIYMFDNAVYSFEQTDSGKCVVGSDDDGVVASFSRTDDVVSRVDFTTEQLVGTWRNAQGQTYTFATDGTLSFSFMSSSTWSKSDIPHVVEVGYGSKWCVRMLGDDMVIMAGYSNILFKQ